MTTIMNVLLIEDEKDLAKAAAMQLESLGHSVEAVHDLAAASRVLDDSERHFGLVIADHALPDGRGIEFVLRLRKAYDNCEYAIVSGCLTDTDVALLEAEGLAYYRKPLLYRIVIDDLRKQRAARGPMPENGSESAEAAAPSTEGEGKSGKRKRFGWFGGGKGSDADRDR